jgi:hypothetical protein
MYYATHVIGPLLALADTRAVKVHCLGSGKMRDELVKPYNNPYPIETAMFQLENSDAVMEVTRSLYETARSYQEGFNILGDRLGFEWGRDEKEAPVLYRMEAMTQWRGRPVNTEAFEAPDCPDLLPASINRFTKEHLFTPANSEPAITIGGGHHGSHPHLVHEFISSIIENRKPRIDAVTAANWTAAGICAHQSAMRDGEGVEIPSFEV